MNLSLILNNNKYKIAFGLFITYLCFTIYKIGETSLWYDECFSIDLGNDSCEEIIHYSLYNDTNPPFYILLIHFWIKVFGDSEVALRSVSAISGSLACSIFFLLALKFFNWQTAVFSILLYFSSNDLYYYSQEGRTYGLILFLCIISNFTFLNLIKKPNWTIAVLLGLINICIFYSHTLACINIIGQILLVFILCFNKGLPSSAIKNTTVFFTYKIGFIKWYLVSWFVFILLFLPWAGRTLNIINSGVKGFWLQKPTFKEYKQVLYDFYNSENLFYIYLAAILVLIILLLLIKKCREDSFNYKLLLIPIILGPFLFHINFAFANLAPIFLKRYILFSLPFFFLLFAYLLSSVNINFKLKLFTMLILVSYSACKMQVPREPYWDYKNGVALLKNHISPTTYIATDNSALFSYYFDRKGAFKAYQQERENILAKSNVFQTHDISWPDTISTLKYKEIFYTSSFEDYTDPEHITTSKLNSRFNLVKEFELAGLKIMHYRSDSIR